MCRQHLFDRCWADVAAGGHAEESARHVRRPRVGDNVVQVPARDHVAQGLQHLLTRPSSYASALQLLVSHHNSALCCPGKQQPLWHASEQAITPSHMLLLPTEELQKATFCTRPCMGPSPEAAAAASASSRCSATWDPNGLRTATPG